MRGAFERPARTVEVPPRDAVLRGDDRGLGAEQRRDGVEGRRDRVGLQAEDDIVLRRRVRRRRRSPGCGEPSLCRLRSARRPSARIASRCGAARDEREVEPVDRREPGGEIAADRAGAEDAKPHQARPSFSARPMRWSLPVAPFGISSRMTTLRGTLKSASRVGGRTRGSPARSLRRLRGARRRRRPPRRACRGAWRR